MTRLLRGRKFAGVKLSMEIVATVVGDCINTLTNSAFINQVGVGESQKSAIDILTTVAYSAIARNTNRRLRSFYVKKFQYPIIRKNHPICRTADIHAPNSTVKNNISKVASDLAHGKNTILTFEVELSISPNTVQIGTATACAVARRVRKRGRELGPPVRGGSGGTSTETMKLDTLSAERSTEWRVRQ